MTVDPPALTQLRRGALEHCVLALLEDDQRYGYDLVQQLADAGLLASEGTIYPLLSRLRRDDLVATTWRESESGPARRYYSLTPQGRAALEAFRTAWRGFSASVDAILGVGRRSSTVDAGQPQPAACTTFPVPVQHS